MSLDLFRCSMSAQAGAAIADLYTPDEKGRVYCGQGSKTDEFEQTFAKRTGLSRAPLGVNSCSAAIDLALTLIGVGPGDEVICSPQNCTASNGPVVTRGAKIVWADIDYITGNIYPESIPVLVNQHTKAVIAVDWAGRSCNYSKLRDALQSASARSRRFDQDIPIIQDAAHRLYVTGDTGNFVCWSFGPIKHLTTGGYGGALLPPAAQRKRAELLRWHGLDRTTGSADFRCAQDITEVGYRYHMTDDQAVVGLSNLYIAEHSVAMARKNAQWYCEQLANIPGIVVPPFDPNCDYWIFGLLIEQDRDRFMQYMSEHGIPTSRVHARNDIHTGFAQASTNTHAQRIGVDYFDAHQVNIPVGWWVTEEERQFICSAVKESVGAVAVR